MQVEIYFDGWTAYIHMQELPRVGEHINIESDDFPERKDLDWISSVKEVTDIRWLKRGKYYEPLVYIKGEDE